LFCGNFLKRKWIDNIVGGYALITFLIRALFRFLLEYAFRYRGLGIEEEQTVWKRLARIHLKFLNCFLLAVTLDGVLLRGGLSEGHEVVSRPFICN
jgi:hypothetical protein